MMNSLNILVVPYRDLHFKERYGSAVRDIQLIEALAGNERVKSVTVLNRPTSLYEVMLGRRRFKRSGRIVDDRGISWCDSISFDLIGPLRGRSWSQRCFERIVNSVAKSLRDPHCINVVLDFHPIARVDVGKLGYDFYWYDLIDNFERHNRFSRSQRELVRAKYDFVRDSANLITGVSRAAVSAIGDGDVIQNGVAVSRGGGPEDIEEESNFDFGFIGFVTNKFDIDFVRTICGWGFTFAVYGEIYDAGVGRELAKIDGVKLFGAFRDEEIAKIVCTFSVGVVPYLRNLLHDESPIKIYKYLYYGRSVLSSFDFGLDCDFLEIYDEVRPITHERCRKMLLAATDKSLRRQIRNSISDDCFWNSKADRLVESIIGMVKGQFSKPLAKLA